MGDELYIVRKYRGAWLIESRDPGDAIVMCEENKAYGPFEEIEDAEFEAEYRKDLESYCREKAKEQTV
jgi:hypothetical protein